LPLAEAALAPDPNWPDYPDGFDRGPGNALSWLKLLVCWGVFLAWCGTTDWLSRDCVEQGLGYMKWNSIVVGAFVVAMALAWVLPWFLLGFPLLLIAYLGPLGAYVTVRNAPLPPHERVFTPDHVRHLFSRKAGKVGVKISEEKKPKREGPPVELFAQGGASDTDNAANLLRARQSPGFLSVRDLIFDAVCRRAEKIMLDYQEKGVAVKYQIDGVWHDSTSRDRASGDVTLAVMKTLAALDPAQRKQRQSGTFAAQTGGRRYQCRLVSQGVKTGERVIVDLDEGTPPPETIEAIGMREKMFEQLKEQLDKHGALVLFSALPGNGLTVTVDAVLKRIDRYMRSFAAVEEKDHRERDIENVDVTTYDASAKESPATVLPKLLRTYPEALVVRDLPDAETVKMLCEQVAEERLVVSTIRAKEAVEALLRVLMLKPPAELFAKSVAAVVNQRLIRVLCDHCKEAYQPTAEALQQLGIPAGRVQQLYRVPDVLRDQKGNAIVCPECGGLGYKGRTGLFELLVVDNKIRQALVQSPKLEVLRPLAAKAGMKSLQQEGIVLVAKGTTSVQELIRVLKQ